MNRFTFIFIVSLFLNSPLVLAGPRVNNGGGAWVCRDQDQNKINWIEILDLTQGIGKYRPALSGSEWDIYEQKLSLIQKQFPKLQIILDQAPVDLRKAFRFLDHSLEVVGDGAISAKPNPGYCVHGLIGYVQIADFLTTGDLIIDKNIWNHKSLSVRSKAALLLHERLYYAFRKVLADETSYRAQKIVGAFFDESLSSEALMKAIQVSLDLDSNVMSFLYERPVVLFPVQLTCTLLIAGFNEVGARNLQYWQDIPFGSSLTTSMAGYTYHVETSELDGSPKSMQVQDDKSGYSAVVDGDELTTLFFRNHRASVHLENHAINRKAVLFCESPEYLK